MLVNLEKFYLVVGKTDTYFSYVLYIIKEARKIAGKFDLFFLSPKSRFFFCFFSMSFVKNSNNFSSYKLWNSQKKKKLNPVIVSSDLFKKHRILWPTHTKKCEKVYFTYSFNNNNIYV